MTCSQCPDKRVRATAPPTCAGNCSANVCGQLLHQPARATPPSTCAGNFSTNVCRQLIRCATVFWQLLHQPFQAHGLLSYPVVGATALPIPPRNHLAVIACLANCFANLFGQLLSPSPIQPQPRSAAALISHSPTQASPCSRTAGQPCPDTLGPPCSRNPLVHLAGVTAPISLG